MSQPTIDLRTQRVIHQKVSRFFLAMQARFKIGQRELVMLMLAAAYGQARRIGLTTPQLIEWAMKNWAACDQEMQKSPAALVVEGSGDPGALR